MDNKQYRVKGDPNIYCRINAPFYIFAVVISLLVIFSSGWYIVIKSHLYPLPLYELWWLCIKKLNSTPMYSSEFQVKSRHSINLLAMPVGIKQKKNVDTIVRKV